MDELYTKILEYRDKNKLTNNECADKLGLTLEDIVSIENGKELEISEQDKIRILEIVNNPKVSKGKRIIKILDLIFRFVAMVMALVTLMLCINENIDTKVLIVLLSIGLVCSSMTLLPKIDK